jgi:uncharacterized protein (TIGR00369 family)
MPTTIMTVAEAMEFLGEIFPAVHGKFELLELPAMGAKVRMKVGPQNIRPGGTVSGPAMFELADCGFYLACFGMIGREALTVTSNATINFLRKPADCDMIADVRILKLGRTLITGDVMIFSEGDVKPVAHATMTYAVPPRIG